MPGRQGSVGIRRRCDGTRKPVNLGILWRVDCPMFSRLIYYKMPHIINFAEPPLAKTRMCFTYDAVYIAD